MHLNIRSIQNIIYKLNNYSISLDIKFSIIGLTKTWLKEEMLELYELPEYKSIHLTRPSRKGGGGVSLYVQKITEYMECLFAEVMSQTRTHTHIP